MYSLCMYGGLFFLEIVSDGGWSYTAQMLEQALNGFVNVPSALHDLFLSFALAASVLAVVL